MVKSPHFPLRSRLSRQTSITEMRKASLYEISSDPATNSKHECISKSVIAWKLGKQLPIDGRILKVFVVRGYNIHPAVPTIDYHGAFFPRKARTTTPIDVSYERRRWSSKRK